MDLAQLRTPCVMIIFGIDGDLAKRKLLPALYNLMAGISAGTIRHRGLWIARRRRRKNFAPKLDRLMPEYLPENADRAVWRAVSQRALHGRDFRATYRRLNDLLQGSMLPPDAGQLYFYMATIPGLFGRIVTHQKYGLTVERDGTWRRVIIENRSGMTWIRQSLNHELQRRCCRTADYRIDHYLGKNGSTSWGVPVCERDF